MPTNPLPKLVFAACVLFLLTPYGSPPAALALGLAMALTIGNPFPELQGKPTRYLLQASVVLLGFGMNLDAVYKAGRDGILFTIATIAGTLIIGFLIGRMLGVGKKISALISSGTAICGGSAIAAVGPAINAESEEMSVSLGTVFLLNSVALFVFPVAGHLLGMTEAQFGIWAAIAIHDTSSVVGAAAAYGPQALATAATVKLARALWIIPLVLVLAAIFRESAHGEKARIAVPWFIFLFLLAAAIRTYSPPWVFPSLFDSLVNLAKAGMTITLFLIGIGLSRKALKAVGIRPLLQGIILWVAISIASLIAVLGLA